jgi:hypothetical protein
MNFSRVFKNQRALFEDVHEEGGSLEGCALQLALDVGVYESGNA